MYLPASASIAGNHPELHAEIEAVDEMLYEIGGHPIRPDVVADNLDIDAATLTRVLRLYGTAQVLREEQRRYCRHCESLIDGGYTFCDVCDTRFETLAPEQHQVFVVIEPILREDYRESEHDPAVVRLLIVTGSLGTANETQLNVGDERHRIQQALTAGSNKRLFLADDIIVGANATQLTNGYRQNPTILHFIGHGTQRTLSLVELRGTMTQTQPLSGEQLHTILAQYPNRVLLCVMNACHSDTIARHLVQDRVVDVAIGWNGQPSDDVAIRFVEQFYGHLSYGLTIRQSFTLAKAAVWRNGATAVPQLVAADGVDMAAYRLPPVGET